jgi:hypothetical protein
MLERLTITVAALLCLGVIFVLGKTSYKRQDTKIEGPKELKTEESQVSAPPQVLTMKEEFVRSKLDPSTQSFPEEADPEVLSKCESFPGITVGNVRNFIKTLGLVPEGLYPEEGTIEIFQLQLKKNMDYIKLLLEQDEGGASTYKLSAFKRQTMDSEEGAVKLELAPESMVPLSKLDAIEAIKGEVAKMTSEGAILGSRLLRLASEVKFDGELHLARIDLVDQKIAQFMLSQKLACFANAQGLNCVCYPTPEEE